jgi:hypothetical protein
MPFGSFVQTSPQNFYLPQNSFSEWTDVSEVHTASIIRAMNKLCDKESRLYQELVVQVKLTFLRVRLIYRHDDGNSKHF